MYVDKMEKARDNERKKLTIRLIKQTNQPLSNQPHRKPKHDLRLHHPRAHRDLAHGDGGEGLDEKEGEEVACGEDGGHFEEGLEVDWEAAKMR